MERRAEYPAEKVGAKTLLFFAPSPAFLTRHTDMGWPTSAEKKEAFVGNPSGRKKPLEPGMYTKWQLDLAHQYTPFYRHPRGKC